MSSNLTAESYLWEHWKFNADQRLKAFNLLFGLQFLFGVLMTGFGLAQLMGWLRAV